eukprot:CAMPEP_0183572374 /NCGR_PEP_ID=MMETSP0371-20130417/128441_1 /TAXON_ID=268820 /ORGANISM="Peridinium aciculiferum, Strain PAER-2" /LENGTH=141 /DNA_ID=CAMNT_0025782225 /DNA_START=1 /DNA_END=426 /DNA_ORIENTATION=-
MTIQIRAYEKGKVKDQELRELRVKLRKAEAEITQLRTGTAGKMGVGTSKWLGDKLGGGGAESLQAELSAAKEEVSKSKREREDLKRALDLAEQQLSGKAPPKHNDDGAAMRKRVEELETQLREAVAADGKTKKKKKQCTVM